MCWTPLGNGPQVSDAPHIPLTTSAGHFLSMQPNSDPMAPADKLWYRADVYAGVVAKRDKYLAAVRAVYAIMCDENETGDGDTLCKIIDICEGALK